MSVLHSVCPKPAAFHCWYLGEKEGSERVEMAGIEGGGKMREGERGAREWERGGAGGGTGSR